MKKWRCKSNGVIIELKDIETKAMREHDGYEEVKDDAPRNSEPSPKKTKGKRSKSVKRE